MDMTNIFNELMQAIDEGSYQYISPKVKHRQEEYRVEQHLQWLEAHLNDEEKVHLKQLLDAELHVAILENRALVKTAIAAGIRLALPR